MTQSNLLELAKQGDPTAIATMMNQQLQPKGITATTDLLPGRCLQVVLESAQALNRQALTTFVEKGLKNLGVRTLDSVKIIGRQIGSSEPAWIQDIGMAAVSPMSNTEPFPEAVPPRVVTPPPPPPNRGSTPIVPLAGTDALISKVEPSTDAAALHDFHDSRFPNASPDNGDELPNYSPIPGAYRPLEADNALLLNDSDLELRGTHALDYPDHPLEESDDYDYGDDYDVMPGGSHALHYPDDPLDDPEDYGDDYDEGFVVSPSFNTSQTDDSLTLDDYDDNYDTGVVVGSRVDDRQLNDLSEGEEPEQSSAYIPPTSRDVAPIEEEYSPIPWTALIVSLVATWIVGLVGYALWSGAANRTAQQPTPGVAPASAPPASPTVQANVPASPGTPASPAASPPGSSPATSPSPVASANPALQFTPTQASPTTPASPSPQASASPAASPSALPSPTTGATSQATQANLSAAPAPPAIACRPVPFGANSGPVELSNLGFDTSIADADGHYVVGCITNHSDQAIAKLTISFQGRSTQNQAVSQTGSTDLTFANLRPRQAVPFRSLYTVNPEINAMTITSISWISAGSAQPRQVQVNFPLRR
ncbi:MAG: hypothetical protein SFY66_04685 [Oculatellaceae cyanobacterium bins.114]|nr:hypothetical protein [Oculatellaceae cyanobacterium bins.114]